MENIGSTNSIKRDSNSSSSNRMISSRIRIRGELSITIRSNKSKSMNSSRCNIMSTSGLIKWGGAEKVVMSINSRIT